VVHVKGGQQGTAGLASPVHRDPGHLGFDDAAIETTTEVSRFQGRTVTGREHEACIDPGLFVRKICMLIGQRLDLG
jgi:hypothetical protein